MIQTVDEIRDFHAHVYYDAPTKVAAQQLRSALEQRYPQAVYGRWHDRPVGPHPDWSTQIAFGTDLFTDIVSFMAINRGDLVIFIHPNTGHPLANHRDHAIWMGAMRPLVLDNLPKD